MLLLLLFQESYRTISDSDMRARLNGIQVIMGKFDFLFGLSLNALLLGKVDNLSKSLQDPSTSAAEGQGLMTKCVNKLKDLRNDTEFEQWFRSVRNEAKTLKLSDPSSRNRVKNPKYDYGCGPEYFPETVEEKYRAIYYEGIDLCVNKIQERLDQPGYASYRRLENLLLKAAAGETRACGEDMKFVLDLFGNRDDDEAGDIKGSKLKAQIDGFADFFEKESPTLSDVICTVKKMTKADRKYNSELIVVYELLMVMPATNAVSERSFSALRRVKTYLRCTMTQKRLNHLMLLNIHCDVTDELRSEATLEEY